LPVETVVGRAIAIVSTCAAPFDAQPAAVAPVLLASEHVPLIRIGSITYGRASLESSSRSPRVRPSADSDQRAFAGVTSWPSALMIETGRMRKAVLLPPAENPIPPSTLK